VCTFDGEPWRGRVDVISGGFPCQDISAAGKGAGITGARSGLWHEMARIIGEVRPRYVFVENSPLLVGRGLAVVLGDLAALGYDARWCVLGARDAGAPHRRDRVWVLASNAMQKRGEGVEFKEVYRKQALPWGKNIRSVEDLRVRSSIPAPALCRVADGVASRVDRLKAIGNGQVPQCAAMAWKILTGEI